MRRILIVCAALFLLLPLGAQENPARATDDTAAVFENGRYIMELIAIDFPVELVIDGTTWTCTIDGEDTVDEVDINYDTKELVFPSMRDFASVFYFRQSDKGIDLFFAESAIFGMLDFSVIFGSEGSGNSVTADAREIFQAKMTDALRSMPVIRLIKQDAE